MDHNKFMRLRLIHVSVNRVDAKLMHNLEEQIRNPQKEDRRFIEYVSNSSYLKTDIT